MGVFLLECFPDRHLAELEMTSALGVGDALVGKLSAQLVEPLFPQLGSEQRAARGADPALHLVSRCSHSVHIIV
jgi:hypothetical protein